MNRLADKPINLAKALRQLRRNHRLSLNRLAQLTGISRRTLARIESGYYTSHQTESGRGARHPPRLSPRTAFRLARFLLPPEQLQQVIADYTRPLGAKRRSRAESRDDDPYDLLPDLYPAFLFHDLRLHSQRSEDPERSRRTAQQIYDEFAPGYAPAFFRLILLPEKNLLQRLQAFRLQHDLTLKETAYLLDLSTSQLHRLERAERQPSPRTRFKLLRLLTLPLSPEAVRSLSRQLRGPRPRPCLQLAGRRSRVARRQRLDALKALLSIPAPEPIEFSRDPDRLHRLRYLWLSENRSTRALARQLGISPPHLIRLLRGDRRPSRSLRERIEALSRFS
ncbi:MAG: helix-turn-helix domain-containing protein [Terriglobia bacterium]